MDKTSLKQKLLLVIFGLFLTLILLEVGLRIAGAFVLYLQEQHNHLSFNKNEYRILCLGESTTALGGEDAYPRQLEVMLNAQGRQRKFTVINKGIISTTSNYILTHIDQNLDTYKPKMVIVMMGINDRAYLHGPNKSLWWENIKSFLKDFRVYKLAHLLYEHTTHRIKEIKTPVPTVDESPTDTVNDQELEDFLKNIIATGLQRFSEHMSASLKYQQHNQISQAKQEFQSAQQSAIAASSACIELARRYRYQGLLSQAQDFLEKADLFNVNYPDLTQQWGELYLAQGKSSQAVKAFRNAIASNPKNSEVILGLARAYHQENDDEAFLVYAGYLQVKPQDYWGHIELARWLKENKHYDLAEGYLNQAIGIGAEFDQAYMDLGQLLEAQGQYAKEEAFYLKEIPLHPKSARLYQALGQFYQKQGRLDQAKEYLQKAAVCQMTEYYPATLVNYSLLLDKILSRHVKVIVMQYPLRDIDPLKNYLGQRKDVIFVENIQNFRQALAKGSYNQYFKDNFAYNFGHCTRAGNGLIAHNLVEVILNVI